MAEQPQTTGSAAEEMALGRQIRRMALFVLVGLVLLEGGLRLTGLADPLLYRPDEAAGYRIKPDQHVQFRGNEVVINRWGVRDARPLDALSEGQRRVIVLGDSVTWGGMQTDSGSLFTAVMESNLEDTQTVNAGVNGYCVTQMKNLFAAHLGPLEPDMVVVYAVERDFTRPDTRLTGNSVAFPTRKPRLAMGMALALLRVEIAKKTGLVGLLGPPPTEAVGEPMTAEECIEKNVLSALELRDALQAADAALLVVLAVEDFSGEREPDATIRATLDEAGMAYVDLNEVLNPERDWFITDGIHLSPRGHEAVGKALADLAD